MNKLDVQKRVLRNGKPLGLDKFTWCEDTREFSSDANGLIIDFYKVEGVAIKAGDNCTIKAGDGCTIKTVDGCTVYAGDICTIKAGYGCTIKAGNRCTVDASFDCMIKAGYGCSIKAGDGCTIKAVDGCSIKVGDSCTVDAFFDCTVDASYGCTVNACYGCTIKVGDSCMIKAGYNCAIKAGYDCTIKAGYGCTVGAGKYSVVIWENQNEILKLSESRTIQTPPPNTIDDFIVDGIYGCKPYVVKDGILSEVINQKGGVYRVKNYGEDKITYLVNDGDLWAHGETLKDARDSLIYKATDKDTSEYTNLDLNSDLPFKDCIKMYRTITGACEYGVRSFVEKQDKVKDSYKISEIIELTQGQYGHGDFVKFFNGERK